MATCREKLWMDDSNLAALAFIDLGVILVSNEELVAGAD
jgi:hypothetical protein